MFKRFFDFILHLAGHPYAWVGLFIYAVFESFLLPIPPDILLVAMVLAKPNHAQRFAFITMAGSVMGGLIGYAIGRFGFTLIAEPILEWFCASNNTLCPEVFLPKLRDLFDSYGLWVVGISALSPIIPYRLTILVAGLAHMKLVPFVIMSIVFHWLRYAFIAFIVTRYGKKAVTFVQKRLQWVLGALGGLALVIYVGMNYL